MLTSLALIFLVGLALAALCQKLKLPRIIGMLATGILLGPCVLNVLDGKEEPRVKPEETLNVVSAIEAFYRSAEENREIRTEDLEGYTI